MGNFIDSFALILEIQEREKGEDVESYTLRMAQQLHDRIKRKK